MLVIGYGNDLRRDDGAGRRVAAEIEQEGRKGVRVRSVPQLTPELAEDVAAADCVVFVDASVDHDTVDVCEVAPGEGAPSVMSHHGDPAGLLALAELLGRVPRRAYTVSIPAVDLGLGFELSPTTTRAVATALDAVRCLVGGNPRP